MHIKKKTIIKAIISVIVFIAIVAIIGQIVQKNKKYSKLSDFKTVKEFVEYQGSEYIGEKKSSIENFPKELYVRFNCNLYTENTSNEEYFKTLTTGMAYLLGFENFRVIDNEKQIEIAIVCDKGEQKVIKRYINGDDNYYGTQESINQAKNHTEEKITNIQINSKILNDVVNNNWRVSGVNLGTKIGSIYKHDVYEDTGIMVRNVYQKVFNIVFTENYSGNVINGINSASSIEDIVNALGEPTYGTKEDGIFGYKGEKIYVFFSRAYSSLQISVYRVEDYEKEEFAKLVENYNKEQNVKKFVSSVTDIWRDYSSYEYDTNYVNLQYALKGVAIQFNVTKDHGIIIYENYNGQIAEGKTLQDLKQGDTIKNVYYKNENSVHICEQDRIEEYTKME